MALTDSVAFDSLYIIESLPPGDPKTGTDLADAVTYGQHHIAVHLERPVSRDAFLDCLRKVAANSRNHRHSPILHIETHGNSDGIGSSSGQFITWPEIKDALTEINTASQLNLLVVMAACHGGHLAQIVRPTDRAPVWAVVGPPDPVTPEQIAVDFRAFYRDFLNAHDGRRALEALNSMPVGPGWCYGYYPARFLFRQVYHQYLKECCSTDTLEQRVNLIVGQLVGNNAEPPGLRNEIRTKLNNHEVHFRAMRHHFFMIDLYPENDARFPLTLADCLRHPSEDPD